MRLIRLKKLMALLLAATLNTVVFTAGNTLMTAEQRHIALCVQTIAHQYYNHGRSTVVSMPPDLRNNSKRPLIQFPYSDNVQLVDLVLQHLYEDKCCPVQMLPPKTELDTTAEINHSYIILIWCEQEDEDILDILDTQLNQLKDDELLQWNPRGRFTVVVTDQDSRSLMSEALKIYEIMWMEYKVVNSVVRMPSPSGNNTELDLYSGLLYQNGNYEKVKEITLVDQWVLENNGTFSEKTNLYPSKNPNNFQKCVIKAVSILFHPFVSLISTDMKEDGNNIYEIRGLTFEYFLLSVRKMNLTVVFLEPSLDISSNAIMTEVAKLTAVIADIFVGVFPLAPVVVSARPEPSIPYISGPIKWFVPCPKPISRVERFLTVFDASVWVTMIIVFVLTSALFWFSANYPDRMFEIDSKILQTIPKCMYNAWSIFIGVSVPKMPRSWKVRIFFLIYVCVTVLLSVQCFRLFSYRILSKQNMEGKLQHSRSF
jgi:hypothetical protein